MKKLAVLLLSFLYFPNTILQTRSFIHRLSMIHFFPQLTIRKYLRTKQTLNNKNNDWLCCVPEITKKKLTVIVRIFPYRCREQCLCQIFDLSILSVCQVSWIVYTNNCYFTGELNSGKQFIGIINNSITKNS